MNRFNRRTKWLAGGVLALAIAAGGVGLAMANGADDDLPLTGTDLDRATQAALEHTGGGTAIETEVGDDGAAYGVEIRKDDGSVVEVQLDDSFNVIGDEADDDGATEDDDGATDD
jgi:uncharacterized membrane protein YkoI